MTSSRSLHLLWGSATVCLCLVSYFLGGDAQRGSDRGLTGTSVSASGGGTGGDGALAQVEQGGAAGEAAPGTPLPPDQMRAKTFGVLSEVNRVERIGHLCDVLARVDKSNWQEMLDGFIRQRGSEGRNFKIEWELALERIGEVGGQDAITTLLASKESHIRGAANWVLAGWAAQDPTASLEWVKQQPDNVRGPLLQFFFKGIGRSAPKQAVEFALTLPLENARQHLPFAVYSAIQSEGFRGAEEMLAGVSNRSDVNDGIKNTLLSTLAQTQLEAGRANRDLMKPLTWLDPYLGKPFLGPGILKDLVTPAGRADPEGLMAWATARHDRFTPAQEEATVLAVSRHWREEDPAGMDRWLAANADHPQHDTVLEDNLVSALANWDYAGAEKLQSAMRDPERQAKARERIQKMRTSPMTKGGAMEFKGLYYEVSPLVDKVSPQ